MSILTCEEEALMKVPGKTTRVISSVDEIYAFIKMQVAWKIFCL
jgi:hypothetical protein